MRKEGGKEGRKGGRKEGRKGGRKEGRQGVREEGRKEAGREERWLERGINERRKEEGDRRNEMQCVVRCDFI